MDFLLGSLTAGTGGDGMNLGTIENMEVNIPEHYYVLKYLTLGKLPVISVKIRRIYIMFLILGIGVNGVSCMP